MKIEAGAAVAALLGDEPLSPDDATACCAAIYADPAVRWVLGGDLHPGGAELTLHAAGFAGVGPGSLVVDVASGTGASALLLAREHGSRVTGIDASDEAVAGASARASAEGLADRVSFVVGDAHSLPLPDDSADAILCECALCTFSDKQAALAEMLRVLAPGGTLVVTDVISDRDALPGELREAAMRVACVADALPEGGYLGLMEEAGFEQVYLERHDGALGKLVDRVESRLRLARIIGAAKAGWPPDTVERGLRLARLAAAEVERGTLGYAAMVATAPVAASAR